MPDDYPPEYDDPETCEVCGKDVADCTCPECPVCHVIRRPECYVEHGLTPPPGGFAALRLADRGADAIPFERPEVVSAETRRRILQAVETHTTPAPAHRLPPIYRGKTYYHCPRCHADHFASLTGTAWVCVECGYIGDWKLFIPYPDNPPPQYKA